MNDKHFIGISLGFNSSACIMSEKKGLIAAVSQERINGIKNTKEIPMEAIVACISQAKCLSFEAIGVSHYQPVTVDYIQRYLPKYLVKHEKNCLVFDLTGLSYLKRLISRHVIAGPIHRVEHHKAHELAVQCCHGFRPQKEAIIVTLDGFGDGISGRITTERGEVLSSMRIGNSVGLIYQFVTGALGFKEHQHEGKITGLAAYGEPIYISEFYQFVDNEFFAPRSTSNEHLFNLHGDEFEQVHNSQIEDFDLFLRLKRTVYAVVRKLVSEGAKREDIAASVQLFTEVVVTDWIQRELARYYGESIPKVDVYLAGGVAANVKLNQRIHERKFVDNIYVCPPMGDEGTCIGAAFSVMRDYVGEPAYKPFLAKKASMLLGTDQTSWTLDEVKHFDKNSKSNFKMTSYRNDKALAGKIADLLSRKKIVCLFRGKMEFGPRALCNRSILYHAEDASVNKWLNDQLGRTEFMPFAPFCKAEDADKLFYGVDGARQTAEYMTITFSCKMRFLNDYPAAAHVDDTARPQFVTKETNSLAYDILTEYEKKTGKIALINTSFNIHNNPIIESPLVAVESWKQSKTDVLVIGNVIIERSH